MNFLGDQMFLRALDHLVCPISKAPLRLITWVSSPYEPNEAEKQKAIALGVPVEKVSEEIITGVVITDSLRIFYPIFGGIPRMLTFQTAVSGLFCKKFRDKIEAELKGYRLPNLTPPPGEKSVLKSFSREWLDYDWKPDAYWNLPAKKMFAQMRFALNFERHPVEGKLVLEAGIGIGGIANYVSKDEGAEVIGIDLGYAVDAAYKNFKNNPFFHIIQASVFRPPFREQTFDFVYSQGVIHHTYSTKKAFDQLSPLPKMGGRLYIWVYSPRDESRTRIRRALLAVENIFRPICSRLPEKLQTASLLPFVPLYLFHQNVLKRRKSSYEIAYGWREAIHAARDRFTPRYIFRHTEEEVSDWFHEAGYSSLRFLSKESKPDFVSISMTACTGIDGVRSSERCSLNRFREVRQSPDRTRLS
jgi:ubiquinone/menaquinone biosynthesis C-methylase UbiE/uncharacterized protein YbaR (Trm112 family)